MKDKFIQFLKDNNAYDAFLINFKCLNLYYEEINEYLDRVRPENYLLSAFRFKYSDRGFMYWNTLNNMWNNLIES